MALRTFAVVAVLAFGSPALAAEFVEIFETSLNGNCTPAEVAGLSDEVDELLEQFGYTSEVLATQHGMAQTSVVWIGRSPSSEAWGKAHDFWRSDSRAAAVAEKIAACGETISSSTHTPAG